jgi:hypothetical protein
MKITAYNRSHRRLLPSEPWSFDHHQDYPVAGADVVMKSSLPAGQAKDIAPFCSAGILPAYVFDCSLLGSSPIPGAGGRPRRRRCAWVSFDFAQRPRSFAGATAVAQGARRVVCAGALRLFSHSKQPPTTAPSFRASRPCLPTGRRQAGSAKNPPRFYLLVP